MSGQNSTKDGGEGASAEEIPLVPPPAYDPDWLNEYHVIGKTPANTPTTGDPTEDVPTITVTSTSTDDIKGKEFIKKGARPRVNETMDNKGAHVHDDDEYAHYAHRADSPVAIRRGDEYRVPMAPMGDHTHHSWNHNTDQTTPSVHYRPCPTRDPVLPQDSQDSEPDSHHGFSAHDMYFLGDTCMVTTTPSIPEIPDPIPVFIEPLPPAEAILLANKQPKDIAQYESGRTHLDFGWGFLTTKNWKADETMLENLPAGIVSVACHLGVFIWLAVLLWQIRLREEIMARNSAKDSGASLEDFNFKTLVVSALFLLGSYALLLMEAYISYTRQYLVQFITAEGVTEFLQQQRLKSPKLFWTLDTFKNQPARPTTKLERNKILKQYSRILTDENEPNKIKVVFDVPFKKVIDVSGDIKSFKPGVMTRLEVTKTFGFTDEESGHIYERIKHEFLDKFHNRSKKSKLKENFNIDDYCARMTIYDVNEGRSWIFSEVVFWIATVCLLTWPYRWWFRAVTEKKKFTLVKLIELVYDGGVA